MAACEKCIGTTCYGGVPCNIECLDFGTWCETRTMGGGADGSFDAAKKKSNPNYDYCSFLCQRVMKTSKPLEAAGIEIGDIITHVDDLFYNDVKDFAAAVLDLRGKRLRFIRPDGTRGEVTLK